MVPVDLLAEEVKSVDEEAFESTVLASEANRSQSTTSPVLCEHSRDKHWDEGFEIQC